MGGLLSNGKICLCVDLRSVNENIVLMIYPLPNIETLLASVKDANYVTKLDLKSAYHHLPLHEDTKKLTAFTSYSYKKLQVLQGDIWLM